MTTARRIEYAAGFIELGLLKEASDELEAVEGERGDSVLAQSRGRSLRS